ncbi:RNA polymerase sigma-70 factor [Salinisphaera sp. PC39]|uniref:RNA polymerase sigma-70 factor n=1 Tax=Salinisphaera sp. PC39 TaxID=1304156 RepID=UPI00333E82BA
MSPVRDDIGLFDRHRGAMFGLAYRMLGDAAEAEDMVQEAYLRWAGQGRPTPASPGAYFSTVVTRLCLDHLRSARLRRTDYVGPWLPEPLPADEETDPVERADDLSVAFLLLLERLSPPERAVFLLRQAFELDYADIAAAVDRSEAHCRKLFSRARRSLARETPRHRPTPAEHAELLARFAAAYRDGDMDGLLAVLAPDSTLVADSGGKVPAARRPIHSAERVARFLTRIRPISFRRAQAEFVTLNGEPGLALFENGRARSAIAIEIEAGRIRGIFIQRNPDKLRRIVRP